MTDQHRSHTPHHDHHGHGGHDHHAGHGGHATVKDPVCGMMVGPERSAHHAEHGGRIFHFCSARCHDKFVANPEQYLKPEAKPAAPEKAGQASPQQGVIYTCPMHPEIRYSLANTPTLEALTKRACRRSPNGDGVDLDSGVTYKYEKMHPI